MDAQLQGLFCHQCSSASLATVETSAAQQLCPNCGSEFVETRSASTAEQQGPRHGLGDMVVSRVQFMVPGAQPGTWQEVYPGGGAMPLPGSLENFIHSIQSAGQPRARGTPAEAVAALPRVKVQDAQPAAEASPSAPDQPAAGVTAGQQCTVCHDDFAAGAEVVQLPCHHSFHERCITPWLEGHITCPVCRQQVPGAQAAQGASQHQHDELSTAMEDLLGELGGLATRAVRAQQQAGTSSDPPADGQEAARLDDLLSGLEAAFPEAAGQEQQQGQSEPLSVPRLLEVFHNELDMHQLLWSRVPTLDDFERLWPGPSAASPAPEAPQASDPLRQGAPRARRPPAFQPLPGQAGVAHLHQLPPAAALQAFGQQQGQVLNLMGPQLGLLRPAQPLPFPQGRWVANEEPPEERQAELSYWEQPVPRPRRRTAPLPQRPQEQQQASAQQQQQQQQAQPEGPARSRRRAHRPRREPAQAAAAASAQPTAAASAQPRALVPPVAAPRRSWLASAMRMAGGPFGMFLAGVGIVAGQAFRSWWRPGRR